jgi:hypothetical protein
VCLVWGAKQVRRIGRSLGSVRKWAAWLLAVIALTLTGCGAVHIHFGPPSTNCPTNGICVHHEGTTTTSRAHS